ncbi:MAG: PAS domain S-box protein [Leptolyngbyaceae cyanobacterium bins.302]|nr:PAS domain S-box protein [Leptolyngbyaceae cyanobacterium bins.302]
MKILVVEDDQAVAQTLKTLLSGYNYAVDVATDSESGWQMVEAFDYDLILLDVILPGMDGIGLCQRLRAEGFQRPILLLTGQDGGQQKAIALNAGADDYVVKPFDAKELIARVQALLRRSHATNQPILTWGELTIDPSSCQVIYNTHLISLTPKEYGILELFLRSPRHIFSSKMILEHAWNSLESPGEESVRVHIKELRQKLSQAGAPKDLIKTIHRVGYQLNSVYATFLTNSIQQLPSTSQMVELKSVNEELKKSLEELQVTQASVLQQNAELELAYQALAQKYQLDRDREAVVTALQNSEHRYTNLTEAVPVGIFRFDAAGQCTYVNHRWSELTGRPKEAAMGMAWLEAVYPDDREHLMQTWRDWVATWQPGHPYHHEGRIVRPDDTIVWVYVLVLPDTDADGTLTGYVGSLTDISERKQAEIELREMSLALSNTIEGISRLDTQGCYIAVNDAYAAIVGYTPAEMLGMSWQATVHPDDLEHVVAAFQQMVNTGKIELKAKGVRKDGSTFHKTLFLVATYDAQHCVTGHYCFMKDITEQKYLELARQQAEAELKQSEQKFRAIFNSTFQFIGVLTPDGTVIDGNRAALEIVAVELADVVGKPFWETPLWTPFPEQQALLKQAIARAAQGEFIRLETKHIWADGSLAFVDFSLKPVFDESGQVIMLIPEGRDITDRKQSEQKIREQATLLDIASDAIFVRNLEHHILYWNQGAERLYGWQGAEALDQNAIDLLQEDRSLVPNVLRAVFDQGEWRGEVRKVTKTGKEVIVSGRWTLVRNEAGQPRFILTVDTDITEKKQLEAQFYQAQRLESLGTLTSGIAHDLNNILTPILAIAQMFRATPENFDPRTQEMLHTLENSAKRGADLVKQILTFTRGTGGKQVKLLIKSVLLEVFKVAEQTFPKSIHIQMSFPSTPIGLISADPTQLHQVFMNLCVNARDAMPKGGVLSLSVEPYTVDEVFAQMNLDAQVGSYVLVTVADTGTGIPPEVCDRIFEPFFTTKALGQGTGLGLSTVLGIIRNYGGFLQVVSEVGKGSQFKVYLPTIEGTTASPEQPGELLRGDGELVLVVDDDVAVQQINRSLLENYRYTTLAANDGIEAIALYAQHQDAIKVVMIDIMMPHMDGTTAIRTLLKINPQVQVIAVSGLAAHKEPALAAGAKVFLTKPYTIEELLRNLHGLVN